MMWQHGKWVGRQLALLNRQIRVIGGHGRWVDAQKVSFQRQEGWWDIVATWKVGGWPVSHFNNRRGQRDVTATWQVGGCTNEGVDEWQVGGSAVGVVSTRNEGGGTSQ